MLGWLGKPKAMRWQIIFLPKIQRPLLINIIESICFGCPSHLPILILTTPEPLFFLGQSTGTFRSRLSGGWRSAGCAWRRRCESGWAGASRPSSTWCGRWQNRSGTGGGHFSPGRSLAQGDEHLKKKRKNHMTNEKWREMSCRVCDTMGPAPLEQMVKHSRRNVHCQRVEGIIGTRPSRILGQVFIVSCFLFVMVRHKSQSLRITAVYVCGAEPY